MNFKSSFFTLLALFGTLSLFSKNIYLRYDAACMDRLEYRLNGNMTGNGLISYSLRASDSERIVMEIGVESIKQVKRAPRGLKGCGKIKVDDLLANAINSRKDKVYIVRKVGSNYIVSPVHLATYIKDSPKQFSMRGNQFDMTYNASDIGLMENNLAVNNSSTKVYFIGSEMQACRDAYILKKIPEETCKPYTDLTFLPGLGVVEEKTGVNQADAESNILRLVKVNDIPLAEYVDNICNDGKAELAVRHKPVEENVAFKPATTSQPTPPQPAQGEVVFPVSFEAPAPEHRPAGSDLIYEYDKPQPAEVTFTPKGVDCTNLSYEGVHIVQTSQTLYSIARQYNLTVKQLRTWNELANADLIKPCQSLNVLPPTSKVETVAKSPEVVFQQTIPTETAAPIAKKTAKPEIKCDKLAYDGVHIVQSGETLYSIAKANGVKVDQIQKWNKLDKHEAIIPCMSLYTKTPEVAIAAINNPDPGTPVKEVKNTTIPRNIPTESSQVLTSPQPASTVDLTAKGSTSNVVTGKMWNSGIEYHVVQKGETLSSLARTYGFTLDRFRDINGLGQNNMIRVGQVLRTGNCLCPADGVGPTSSNTYNGANNVRVEEFEGLGSGSFDNASINNGGGNAGSTNTGTITEKGSSSTTQRNTQSLPVPVPYDYETESILNNAKRGDATISYRNGRKVHTVQENETMAMIANKYNIPIESLRTLNKMEKNEIVIPEMKIYLE